MDYKKTICNLKKLNCYMKLDITRTDVNVRYWQYRIKQFGEDTPTAGGTYGQCLQESIKTKEDLEKELEKNEMLIQEIEEDEQK